MNISSKLVSLAVLSSAAWASAQPALVAPYSGSYTLTDIGSVPGVPNNYGGLTIKYDNPNIMLIGGAANGGAGQLYAISVIRDGEGHITGFTGEASPFAVAAYNDGGVSYGPGNVLFLARWSINEMGQLKPGSSATDRIIPLGGFGVEVSCSSLNFVPTGFPGAGRMKLCTYGGGQWNEVSLAPDGNGTYDITHVTQVPIQHLQGGPEGFTYPPVNSPLFASPAMLMSEYAAGKVVAYDLDGNGDPIVASRREFITGLGGAEGANIDPVTGDFLFSTFGGGSRVIVVKGFSRPCRADFNGDGFADFFDYADFVDCFEGVACPPGQSADFDHDGFIDFFDLDAFIAVFEEGC